MKSENDLMFSRSDSFDLNVALQDHFKLVKNEDKILQVRGRIDR